MIAVIGSFRLPPERVGEALPLMRQVIAATLREPGCLAYSYAEDVNEPGRFRVMEKWTDRAALDAHFATGHMRDWASARERLGFHDREIMMYALGEGAQL